MRSFTPSLSLLALALSLAACGGEAPAPKAPAAPPLAELERYFPLVDGKLFAYLSHGETGGTTLVVLRVERKSPGRGSLKGTSSTRDFTVTANSIDRVGGGTVLKLPLKEGTAFVGERSPRPSSRPRPAPPSAPTWAWCASRSRAVSATRPSSSRATAIRSPSAEVRSR